jgi:2',3'-cyclic-nucleotide 2'-phosphodiesterase (5'-nucleotidase family)
MLLVDGGDFIFREKERGDLETTLMWTNMEALKYDAVTLGELELSQLDLVQQLMEKSPIPLVESNVEVLRNGVWEPLGQKSLIATVNGVKVGFLSLISENEASPAALGDNASKIRILPPTETAAAVAAQLRKSADLVVLLAHVDGKTMEEYASALPDVDVIVGGHVTIKDEGPVEIGHVILNRSGTRGQSVCSTRLIVSPEGRVVDYGGINVTLGPGFREDSTVLAQVNQVKEEGARLRQAKMQEIRGRMEQKSNERQADQAAPDTTTPPAGTNPIPPAPPAPPSH